MFFVRIDADGKEWVWQAVHKGSDLLSQAIMLEAFHLERSPRTPTPYGSIFLEEVSFEQYPADGRLREDFGATAQLRFMDHWWEDHHRWMQPKLEEPSSFYFKRNFWATFEDDRPAILTRYLLGVDRLMWGSDYPHTEGTFPFSIERIRKDFMDAPEEETRMMVRDNVARLYGLA